MTILIYYFEDFNDSLHILNFEYFINYGIKNSNWGLPKRPITNIFLFVNDKTKFYNQYNKSNLYNVFIEIIVIETIFVDSIRILSQFYKHVETYPNVLTHDDPTIFYVNSKLIGPVIDPGDLAKHWVDILIDKIDNETHGVKHFTKNLFIFNYRHYQNRLNELKRLLNLDVFFFRKNTMPVNFDYGLYKTYLIECCLINSYTANEHLVYHYLKYNRLSYDEIEYLVKNKMEKSVEYEPITHETCNEPASLNEIQLKEIVVLANNPDFDIEFYKSHHPDLHHMSYAKLMNHYIRFGEKEGRIVSNKHASILADNPDFDIDFYKSHHPDLHHMSPAQLVKHYMETGKSEGRIVSNEHNITPNHIMSISHSLGGGTQSYINNISKLYNINYEINIDNQELFSLKRNGISIKCDNTYNLSNIISDNTIVLFNHLLTRTSTINMNMFYNIYNNCKHRKIIFIIHDYHLIYPDNPTPCINTTTTPNKDDIQFTNDMFSKCDLVVFNSYNCFNNYKKYINLENYNCIVTNSTPDIMTNNYNIYPGVKSGYNIGVLGRVNAVHKGFTLLNDISHILSTCSFKVFGVNNNQLKLFNTNITLCGEYNNDDIFELIANHNIDFFMFISIVDETYSFTLSIAMQTGLPIFYNDIGCYRERLFGRSNTYAFNADKLHMLPDLITNMNTSITNNGTLTKPNMSLNNNNADFNWMLTDNNDYEFDVSLIKESIINNNVCFIHFTNTGNNYDIFLEQMNNIKSSGLYSKFDFIFITMLGPHIKLFSDPKIIVIYYSPNELELEYPTIKLIKSFSYNINKKVNILYVNICQQNNSYVNYMEQYNHYIHSNRNITYYTEHITFFNSHVIFDTTTQIRVFPIYFPQFHTIAENNVNFYDGYNDAINLNQLVDTNKNEQFETPSNEFFQINNVKEYNLTNNNIIRKQIELLNTFKLDGFGMYYYWFSVNTITNKNTIMQDVIDKFFASDILGKKIFFIWANEDWSKNAAFSKSSSEKILNYYDYDSITNLKENLITYFLHDNYLKINNKPVFAIHHPWFIPNIFITTLTTELNDMCIKHGFNGIHIICNNFDKNLDRSYNCYEFHPNYKHSKNIFRDNNKNYLNYEKYLIEDVTNTTDINTIFFDFDNRARLINPDKAHLSTLCVNNSNHNKSKMIRKIFNSYYNKNQDAISNINNMLFINAWNEWGEKMHIEPSNENNFYYLEKLEKYINFHNSYKNYTTLFHKYTLKIASPYNEITYSLINEKNIDNQNITHLHIYDLNTYNEYISYICVLKHDFHIIITYILGNPNIVDDFITVIKCDNMGADIGPKICVLDYLYNNNIEYEYILFLHSKSDISKREKYFQFVDTREKITKILIELKNNSNILAAINNDLLFDFKENALYNYGTQTYVTEFLHFFNINADCETKFSEGNVLLLKKPVLDFIFSDRTTIFYNSLNNYTNSFDLNWARYTYNDFESNPIKLYNTVTANASLAGSDFACESNKQLRDCQIEHLFERIWLYVVKHLGGLYYTS